MNGKPSALSALPALASHSLRTRLLLLLFTAIALFALMQGIGAYRGAVQQADALFDEHLQQMAHVMPGRLAGLAGVLEDAQLADIDVLVQVWGPDGVQLFRSSRSLLPQSGVLGFSDVTVQGRAFRVYTVQTPLQTVQVAQDMSARNDRARALAWRSILPVALLAPLLMLVVWWVVSRSLAPVERMRRQIAQRAAEDLSPLPVVNLPSEVAPLVQELNALFGRVQLAFAAQQNFVADAAHELRSPLAALKLQAQALRGDGAPDPAVTRLNQGIDRAIHLVGQLLALARAQDASPSASLTRIDLQPVLRLAVGDVLVQASAKSIDVGLSADSAQGPVWVHGQPQALRMLVSNLLDNAIKYSPAQGQVDVSVQADERGGDQGSDQGVVLTVEDSGPGIAAQDRERVFDRFYRTADASAQASGSGLGLAIVQAVARQHHAGLRLGQSARLGGLRVELQFPRVTPDTPVTPETPVTPA